MLDFFDFPLVSLSLLISFIHPVVALANKNPLIFFKLQVVVNFILKFLDLDIKIIQFFFLFIFDIFRFLC
jgi:hypothetical protein